MRENEEKVTTLVCAPRLPGDSPDDQIMGSAETNCEECGGGIWMAPTGQRLKQANPSIRAICVPCAMIAMGKEREEFKVMPPLRSQLEEIEEDRKRRLL